MEVATDSYVGSEYVSGVVLKSGEVLPVDIVILGVGVKPAGSALVKS
jgi:hypothetical protein